LDSKLKKEFMQETSSDKSSFNDILNISFHEINNILAILQGSAEIIQKYSTKEIIPADKLNKKSESILNSIKKLSHIIKILNEKSAVNRAVNFEKINIKEFLEDLTSKISEQSKSICQFTQDDNLFISADKEILLYTLHSLVKNAYESVKDSPNPWIKIYVTQNKNKIQFKVTDSGKILSQDTIAKMMKIFFTTKDKTKHQGIGLSLTKKFIDLNKGQFYFNKDHPNTQFIIDFPKLSN